MKTCVKLLLVMALVLAAGCSRLGRTAEEMRQTIARADSMNKAYVPMDSLGEQLQTAADYFDRHGTANEQVRAHYLLGCVYRDLGEAPEALQHYHDAVDRADTTASDCDYSLLARVHGQMADIFYEENLPNEALSQLSLQSLYGKLAKDTLVWINAFSQRSSVYEMMNMPDSAISIGEKSYQLYKTFGYNKTAAQSLGTLVYYLISCKRYSEAEQYTGIYEKESGYFHEGRIAEGLELYYYLKGKIALGGRRYAQAEKYFRNLLDESTDVNNKEAAFKGLVDLFTEIGETDSIAKYAVLCYNTCNEAFRERTTDEVRRMQALYNYSHHQHIAQAKTEESNQNFLLFLFSAFALMVLTIIFIFVMVFLRHRQITILRTQAAEYQRNMEYLAATKDDVIKLKTEHFSELLEKKQKEIDYLQLQMDDYERVFAKAPTLEKRLANTDIYKRLCFILNHPMEDVSKTDWHALHCMIDDYLPNFYSVINGGKHISEEEYNICILIRLHFAPWAIHRLTLIKSSTLTMKRSRLLKKIFHKEGTPNEFDKLIQSIV